MFTLSQCCHCIFLSSKLIYNSNSCIFFMPICVCTCICFHVSMCMYLYLFTTSAMNLNLESAKSMCSCIYRNELINGSSVHDVTLVYTRYLIQVSQ